MEFVNGKDDIPYMKWKIIHSWLKPPTRFGVLLVGMEGPVGIPTIIIPRNQPMGKGHLRSIEKETDVNCMHCILESSPLLSV
jgi:hypothetical protein